MIPWVAIAGVAAIVIGVVVLRMRRRGGGNGTGGGIYGEKHGKLVQGTKAAAEHAPAASDGELPPGWQMVRDRDSGHTYYSNTKTGEFSRVHPATQLSMAGANFSQSMSTGPAKPRRGI